MRSKNVLMVGAAVVVAGAVGALVFLPTVPVVASDETECCAIDDAPPAPAPDQANSGGGATPAPAGATAQPTADVQAEADRYAAQLEKAKRALALVAEREKLPVAAQPPIVAAPLPPEPPEPGKLPSPEALDEWSDAYDDAIAEQVEEDKGQGVFQLIGTLCKAAVSAVGAPEAGGLCDLVGPILEALGLSLGEGDDIKEAAQALLAVQDGDYGPLQAYLAKNPDVQDGVVRLLKNLERIDPKARERLLGHDLRGRTCSQIVTALTAEPNETQRALLLASIEPAELRRRVSSNQCQ